MPLKKISVVFPGQGSQYVGMLDEYLNKELSFKPFFNQASEILNINLLKLIKDGSKEVKEMLRDKRIAKKLLKGM